MKEKFYNISFLLSSEKELFQGFSFQLFIIGASIVSVRVTLICGTYRVDGPEDFIGGIQCHWFMKMLGGGALQNVLFSDY